jgi:hypothetical protein
MPENVKAALIIGASIIAGTALWGGRYSTSPVMTGQVSGGGVYVIDRFLGTVRACHFNSCRDLPEEERPKAVGKYDELLKKAEEPAAKQDKELSDILHGKKPN